MILLLKYISDGLIIISFISYFLLVLIGRRKKVTNSDGFNITKDLLNEYNSINIILNKGYFTVYNVKRKVIKIANKCYYGNTISDISLSLIEAGISIVHNNKNRFIEFTRKIIPNLKLLYILPLLAVFINSQTYNFSDAKASVVVFIIIAVINYMFIGVKGNGVLSVSNNISKVKSINVENKKRIIDYMNKLLIMDRLIFVSELIMIIRSVMIILDM